MAARRRGGAVREAEARKGPRLTSIYSYMIYLLRSSIPMYPFTRAWRG